MTKKGIFAKNSTFLRVIAPTVAVLCLLGIAMAAFSHWQAKHLYQDLQTKSLENFLNTSRNILASATQADVKGKLQPAEVRAALMQTSLPTGIGLFVFRPSGQVLYKKGVGTPALIRENIGYFFKQGDSASHSLVTPGGETIVGMHMPSRDIFLAIYSQNTFAGTPQSQNIITQVLVVVPLAIIIATALLLLTLQYSLFSPLRQLTRTMRRIIRKEAFGMRVPGKGSQEIAELSGHFNDMMAALQERDSKLKAYSHGLETLVKDRTRDLEDAQTKLVMHERLAAIGEFASSIVHELRNPLSAIKLGIERLSVNNKNEKNTRSLTLTKQEVERLDHMLKGILNFAARRPTDIKPVKMNDFMKDMARYFAAEEAAHKVKITPPRPKKGLVCLADRDKLEQTFLNVLKNAAEATPEGGDVRVSVTEGDEKIHIKVTNQGAPIPPEAQSRLFEPFYTTKKGGTGLGLPTCKKLMEEMNGSIEIVNNKASVTLTLALPKAEAATQKQ